MPIRRRERPAPEIPLTSTADVAFLLLIFFLVAASSQRDTASLLDLPGTVKTQPESGDRNVELVVRPNVYALGDELLRSDADLLASLKRKLAARKNPSDRVVLIAADDAVDYQRWTNVVAAIEQAGGVPAPQMEEDKAGDAGAAKSTAGENGEAAP